MTKPLAVMRPLDSSVSIRGGFSFAKARLWPAMLVTLLTGAGFAGLKFVLIGELAFEYSPKDPLPFEWMDRLVRNCVRHDTLDEAVSQGLAAMLTAGVLV